MVLPPAAGLGRFFATKKVLFFNSIKRVSLVLSADTIMFDHFDRPACIELLVLHMVSLISTYGFNKFSKFLTSNDWNHD
jgi:hypothetical protein